MTGCVAFLLTAWLSPAPSLREELRLGVHELYSGATEQALARFERLQSREPARPEGPLFLAFSLWFAVDEDPFNVDLRRQYQLKVEEARKLARPLCERPPSSDDDPAWACLALGLAHAGLARLYAFEGATLKAAGEARAGKRALERARELEPEDANALLGLGLYNYYSAKLPRILRLLRFMLLLPGGNRERGLAQLEQARERADLLGPEARLQLYDIYKFYEKDYPRALEAIEELEELFPENPRYLFLKILLQGHFMGQPDAALSGCERVLEAVSRRERGFAESAAVWAQYFQATVLFRMGERTRALGELEALAEGAAEAQSPLWRPTVTLTTALAAELCGQPSEALFRTAAREIGRRENVRLLETHIRSVLPPDGARLLRAFEKRFGQYLQD